MSRAGHSPQLSRQRGNVAYCIRCGNSVLRHITLRRRVVIVDGLLVTALLILNNIPFSVARESPNLSRPFIVFICRSLPSVWLLKLGIFIAQCHKIITQLKGLHSRSSQVI